MVNLTRQIYLQYAIEANHYTYKCSWNKTNLTPNCDYCNKTEDNLYLFISCNGNMERRQTNILEINQKTPHTRPTHTLTSNNNNYKCKKLVLTLTQLIINEIWQSRNSFKYHKVLLAQETRNKISNSRPSSTHTIKNIN